MRELESVRLERRLRPQTSPVRVVHWLAGPAVVISPEPEHGVEQPAVEGSLAEVVDKQHPPEIKGFPAMTLMLTSANIK